LLEKIPGYLKALENIVIDGMPQELPLRYYRYVIVSNLIFFFALVGHSVYIPFYWILGAPLPFLLNLFFVPIDLVCLFLNRRRRYKTAFGLWIAVVILHTIVSTLVYGWASGFHYYILSLTVFIFMAPWQQSINLFLGCVIMSVYIWLNVHEGELLPLHQMPPSLQNVTRIANIVVNFIILSYLAFYYAVAAEKAHKRLEGSEKTMKTILAASPVGIALVRLHTIFWANATLERMMGFESGQMNAFLPGCGTDGTPRTHCP